jgi:hypothetical protein
LGASRRSQSIDPDSHQIPPRGQQHGKIPQLRTEKESLENCGNRASGLTHQTEPSSQVTRTQITATSQSRQTGLLQDQMCTISAVPMVNPQNGLSTSTNTFRYLASRKAASPPGKKLWIF